jgi:hypothetical protein
MDWNWANYNCVKVVGLEEAVPGTSTSFSTQSRTKSLVKVWSRTNESNSRVVRS